VKIYIVVETSFLPTMLQHNAITHMITLTLPFIMRGFYLEHCLRLGIYLMTL